MDAQYSSIERRKKYQNFGIFHYTAIGILALVLVAVCFWYFSMHKTDMQPKSLVLEFIPSPSDTRSTLIRYNTISTQFKHWTDSLDKFLEVYRAPSFTPENNSNITNCDYNKPPGPGQVCAVNVNNFEPCTKETYYGYNKSSPCIFFNLKNMVGWTPEFYNDTSSLPEEMPDDLKNHIKNVSPTMRNTVWLSCEGKSPADVEFMGPLQYIPHRGFPGYYYPRVNVDDYLPPLVALHLEKPELYVLVSLQCKAWAKNIKHSEGEGLTNIELLID